MPRRSVSRKQQLYGFQAPTIHIVMPPCNVRGVALPTAAARVRAEVRSSGICGEESGTGAGLLQVLPFPLPILIPPTAPHSSPIIQGWYNRPVSRRRTMWTVAQHPKKTKKLCHRVGWQVINVSEKNTTSSFRA
jgi:hypothetical protein